MMAQLIDAGVGYASEGERAAADALAGLPSDWIIIANKILPASGDRSFEIDFIVIGERTVFVIDAKSRRGRIHGSDVQWVYADGSSERSPLNKIDYVAKVLAGHLRRKVPRFAGIDAHPVVGRILLDGTTERPILRDPRAADGVVMLTDAVDALRHFDARGGDPGVGRLRPQIAQSLVDLSHRPALPRAISDYAIMEAMRRPDGSYVFRADHADGGPRQLAMYDVSGADRVLRDFYLQEFRSLADLRSTGVVPECLDPFTWSEHYLIVPSHVPGGVSLAALPGPTTEADALHEVVRAAAAFEALARVHAAGIIHRALGPEAVYVEDRAGSPKVMLTGFFAAKRGNQTISIQLDDLALADPYAAPEIAAGYGFASADSDAFSLALVFLERLSGTSVSKLVQRNGSVRIPTVDEAWGYFPQGLAEGIIEFFRVALTLGPMARAGSPEAVRLSADECAHRLRDLARQSQANEAIERGSLLDGRYRVERVLGAGASARTFLASDTEASGLFALKQFMRPSSVGEARREFDILRGIPHPHLPRVYDVYPVAHDVHVKLEYVDGAKLTDALARYVGDVDDWETLARGLLGAVEHLERHDLLHRDIKPDNVIIREDGSAVLIDFGAATPADTALPPAGTPGYLPPEAYLADRPPASSDRYALGVLLFQSLTGRSPFRDEASVFDPQPLGSVAELPEGVRTFAAALLKAVAADPDQRYASASEFRAALFPARGGGPEPVPIPLPDLINPTVDLLRGLFRNSARGNADNRGLDSSFALETYVPTSLDLRLLPAILEQHPLAVFLTGNPGDGKTAFLEMVREALRARGGEPLVEDDGGWEWILDGRTFRACYDASEANKGLSADEQLRGRLRGLEGDALPAADLTVLVAINDGRLADFAEHVADEFAWLAGEVDAAAVADHPLEPGGAWVFDLKRRAYVAIRPDPANPTVMRQVLESLVAPTRWDVCGGCAAQTVCPIRSNALSLGGNGDPEAATRLEHMLLLAHLRGQRHITMRDLRSGLAYLITGDSSCDDVHEARRRGTPMPAAPYWQAAFVTGSSRDVMLGELQPLNPARLAQPRLERFLFFHQMPGDAPRRGAMYRDGQDLPPMADAIEWIDRVKRRLTFDSAPGDDTNAPNPSWRSLLPYRHAEEFLAVLSEERPAADMLPDIARGIGRSDGLGGSVLDHGLCLRVAHSDANRLTILKQFPLDEFDLAVQKLPGVQMVEAFPASLVLSHPNSRARVEITLDLFEVLMRLAEGLEPESPELQPLLEDLAPFKNAVQLSNTTDLILVEADHQQHRLSQRDGQVVRESIGYGMANR